MDKLFICLANSYKRGGRCVAGIEIRFNAAGHWGIVRDAHGAPCWIRPISRSANGEIPNEEAIFIDLLSIVRAVRVEPCPHGAHAENVYYERLENTHLQVKLTDVIIDHLLDRYHSEIFYNQGRAIHPSVYSRGNYSLMFIRPESALVYVETYRERTQFRMEFLYLGVRYDFPITDPDFLDFLRDDPEQIGDFPNIMISVSLGLEHEGWHHKLVAGVIGYCRREMPTMIVDNDDDETDEVREPEELSYMEQQKRLHANAYAKWTTEDDKLLMELYSNGTSVKELMERFGRNRGAIRSRLKKLAEEKMLESMHSPVDYPTNDEDNETIESSLNEDEPIYDTPKAKKPHNWKKLFTFWKRDDA